MDVWANEERSNEEMGSTCYQYREWKDVWLMQRGEGRADAERGRTCGCRERKGVVLTMVLIENVMAMVSIEDMLTLLMMIEQLECKSTTPMAMAIAKQQSHTILGVPSDREPAITITRAVALGHQ